MKISCVLFDLDQTLILRTPTIPQKLQQLLEEQHIRHSACKVEKAFADCEYWIGELTAIENQTGIRMSDDEFLAKLTGFYQQALNLPDHARSSVEAILCRRYSQTYRQMPGAAETLSLLQGKGLKLGIVSNNSSAIRETLSELKLAPYFSCIVISEETGLQKPDPAMIRLACERCGAKPEAALYVGDHPFDITCAHDAGAAAAWLPPNQWYRLPEGSRQPELILKSLRELPDQLCSGTAL